MDFFSSIESAKFDYDCGPKSVVGADLLSDILLLTYSHLHTHETFFAYDNKLGWEMMSVAY